jgi:hypothetical protein
MTDRRRSASLWAWLCVAAKWESDVPPVVAIRTWLCTDGAARSFPLKA